mmetsp:Transcript_62149/g.166390  ORF Transcript_62149/g.166390 Transcript_62149/m.166390 type:complete len:158 (+) Transcript_62149:471-944(+)
MPEPRGEVQCEEVDGVLYPSDDPHQDTSRREDEFDVVFLENLLAEFNRKFATAQRAPAGLGPTPPAQSPAPSPRPCGRLRSTPAQRAPEPSDDSYQFLASPLFWAAAAFGVVCVGSAVGLAAAGHVASGYWTFWGGFSSMGLCAEAMSELGKMKAGR